MSTPETVASEETTEAPQPATPQLPVAGEEIHLPGPSIQPLLLTVGITATILGLTTSYFVMGAGIVLSVAVIVRWIADTRRDISHLPADGGH